MKLGQAVLEFIDWSFWDSTSWGMEDSNLGFVIVPDQERAFINCLEIYSFLTDFILPPVPGPCLSADEELRCVGEVVDVVNGERMDIS